MLYLCVTISVGHSPAQEPALRKLAFFIASSSRDNSVTSQRSRQRQRHKEHTFALSIVMHGPLP